MRFYVTCDYCGIKFYKKPSQIRRSLRNFCSEKCQHTANRRGKITKCFLCKKEIYKSRKALIESKGSRNFCSKKCALRWQRGKNHENWKVGVTTYKRFLEGAMPPRCAICNLTDRRILIAHHVDFNRQNNTLNNLTWLCYNCHFLVRHYADFRLKFKTI